PASAISTLPYTTLFRSCELRLKHLRLGRSGGRLSICSDDRCRETVGIAGIRHQLLRLFNVALVAEKRVRVACIGRHCQRTCYLSDRKSTRLNSSHVKIS